MDLPSTASELRAELAESDAPPARLVGRIVGYDVEQRVDLIELDVAGERVLVEAASSGFCAVRSPLPAPFTLGHVRAEVARLLDYPRAFVRLGYGPPAGAAQVRQGAA